MYYYGGGSFNSFPSCGCSNQWFYPSCGWGWGNNNNNNYAIILVLFILLVIVIGARFTR
ncbi:MAG TPA: sporulation protein YjcZ [Candidatus Onthousia excrementipullorum]|uniref:Sporulation protein YjcZ n=1 Tax=Candidatus Onthousia excrementipullorum TaxID=2840884 RepID=A0A9D1DTQ9_9FIRM|nr:sporulation protein YjcZ [Candidatus Onthousia excrementipullorum]